MNTEESRDLVFLYIKEKRDALKRAPIDSVVKATDMTWNSYLNGGTIYACGNGGNGAVVANLITDLSNHLFVADDKTKPLREDIPRLRTRDLCAESSTITANLNDLGKEYIFSQQLINNRVSKYDLVFGFSGSGSSGNIVKAFEVAKKYGADSIVVTRKRDSKLAQIANLSVAFEGHSEFPGQVASNDFNFHYEDFSFAMSHMVVGLLKERIRRKYHPENGN